MTLTIERTDDQALVANLFQYYLYELSAFVEIPMRQYGRFDVDDQKLGLSDYWAKLNHYPSLIKVHGQVAGFALLRPYPAEPCTMEVGQFFILTSYQRKGIGAQAAKSVIAKHHGDWLIRVLTQNQPAVMFWQNVINKLAGSAVTQTLEDYNGHQLIFCRFYVTGT